MDSNYRRDRGHGGGGGHHYNQKRKQPEDDSGIATIVANHYNSINNKDISERAKSRIYHMRNFNNWIKSIIIRDTIAYLRADHNSNMTEEQKKAMPFVVLDLGCGKGGDLIKFQKSSITHLVCCDIASISIEHCKDRFTSMNTKNYTAEFINLDATRNRIRDKLTDPDRLIDMTSCQFSFHYCFESYEQARMMVQNAAESLKIGGIFCGTIPDSLEIMKRLKNSGTNTYGNDVYSISFPKPYEELVKEGIPLFGAKYDFHLDEVVDCPEFLVYFPVFVEICRSFGLQLLLCKRFDEFFTENYKTDKDNFALMNYMDALEKYPPKVNEKMSGTGGDDYRHVREFLARDESSKKSTTFGTLSKSEWEAVTLYLVFSFKKVANGPI
ncbi:PREDICTED: mRNA cap guanine-N7 methyltransferase-like [Rhagoletis zephyria]|uniref:mRNA cap guanine-N7 methyltransferase-like n=1 Tax=Rhagoletis zephyria TaxID=28612 RepID=UPI00081187BC|nr:PREDICTED: mRNA cap guanine-N7 methyltransferase-like [Rhagoletis zephyria]